MINLIRSWFCKHEFVKHVDQDHTRRVTTTYEYNYPYMVRLARIYCTHCGQVKKLN